MFLRIRELSSFLWKSRKLSKRLMTTHPSITRTCDAVKGDMASGSQLFWPLERGSLTGCSRDSSQESRQYSSTPAATWLSDATYNTAKNAFKWPWTFTSKSYPWWRWDVIREKNNQLTTRSMLANQAQYKKTWQAKQSFKVKYNYVSKFVC